NVLALNRPGHFTPDWSKAAIGRSCIRTFRSSAFLEGIRTRTCNSHMDLGLPLYWRRGRGIWRSDDGAVSLCHVILDRLYSCGCARVHSFGVAADRPPCRVDLRQRHVQLAGAPANGCVALARKEFAGCDHISRLVRAINV